MKRTHILGIIMIAVAVAAIVGSLLDSSSYASFEEAFENPGKEYHVVGVLDRSGDIVYNPEANPNLTIFSMIDNDGSRRQVQLKKGKPQDFERSESVVIIGKAQGDNFVANDILMKCPSKYKEENKFEANEEH
jgi:cytochrome c-type biogenesis protein CcmE